jgi:kynurenine formamidase
MQFIDLTHTISHLMPVFPGEASPSIVRDALPDEAGYVTHRFETNMHTGTHIDAPFHVKSDAITIDQFPVSKFAGDAAVIDVRGLKLIRMNPDWVHVFRKYQIILFLTGHSIEWGTEKYYFEYPEFDTGIAEALVNCGVRIAGFDSPSPDKAPFGFHSIFLKDGRFLIENLNNLDSILGKRSITFLSFPVKIEAEASLIRAVAMIPD